MTDKLDKIERNSDLVAVHEPDNNKVSSPMRRKLVMGVTPVAASLISKPIWAGGSTLGRCTISGALSGPSSSHEEELCQGLTPGYWKNHSWPAPYDPGVCTPTGNGQGLGNCDWDGSGTLFSSVFPNCASAMASVYPDFDWANADFMTVLQEDKSGNSSSIEPALQLAFHVVAGLLNSAEPTINYGYTGPEFIALVENFCATGEVAGITLTMEQFKDLLDARNNGDFNWFPV
ncbi:MAG: hypothetical protein K9K86_11945 [Pseudomonadales bacterium]|nr:hypothetical protein [Pseudomonadales bacterium]